MKIVTFGCRLNAYESEKIKERLKEKTNDNNLIIFNSCAVTSEAERQLRQSIRKAKKENPNSKIVVTGCAAQLNPELYKNMPEVDIVLGNKEKMNLANYIDSKEDLSETTPFLISDFDNKARAFIQIQNGCDNKCTFCVTRLARGSSVSIPSNTIISQVKKLVDNGFNEIVLTGINISDYGKGINEDLNLGKLIKKILKETKLPRLRLSSIDISDVNSDLEEVIKNEPRLMPHLHLSLQSGDDTILKRMMRRHNRKQAIDFCQRISKLRKNITFGADFITGFPTETNEMHQNTLELTKETNIVFGHIFPYSERPETPAAKMKQIEKQIRKQRAKELRDFTNNQLQEFQKKFIKTKQSVLIENSQTGRMENYIAVKLNKNYTEHSGKIINIDIKNQITNILSE